MLKQEFEKMTNMTVTSEEYAAIEQRYMAFNGDKQTFAEDFIAKGGPAFIYSERAAMIDRLRSELAEQTKAHRLEVEELQAKLDKELEWKPSTSTGTGMTQEAYEDLVKNGRELDDEKAIAWIAEECGFNPSSIKIIETVKTYLVNRHRFLKVNETFQRRPFYGSTDWNYVRFNVNGFQWELVNGELLQYCN